MIPETKYCPRCETTKPTSEFYRRSARRDGLQSNCKACDNVRRDPSHRPAKKLPPRTGRSICSVCADLTWRRNGGEPGTCSGCGLPWQAERVRRVPVSPQSHIACLACWYEANEGLGGLLIGAVFVALFWAANRFDHWANERRSRDAAKAHDERMEKSK